MIQEVTQTVFTYPVEVSYPEARPVNARLKFAAGRLNIAPGAEAFINGKVVCSVKEWAPQVSVSGGNVTIRQGDGHDYEFKFKHLKHMKNEWSLAFGNGQPFGLQIECGAGQATLALGGLPLTGLQLDGGAGQVNVRFDRPNPQAVDLLKFEFGAGQLILSDLLNANAQTFKLEGGAGEAQVNFTGEGLTRDLFGKISIGVGRVILNVKHGIPTRIETERGPGFLQSFHAHGDFVAAGRNAYETQGYALAGSPKLTIKIESAVGSVELNSI
jgi:hypothetical protein